MNSHTLSSLVLMSGVAVFLGGCAAEPTSHLISAPPPPPPTSSPQVAYAQPAQVVIAPSAQASVPGTTSYIVVQPPPSPRPPEAMPPRPSAQHVWLAGYWTWQNNRYEWMAGRWELPPHSGATWINPRWVPESGSYRFYEGYWN